MKLLAIETTGAKASVALSDEMGKVTVQGSDETMNHLQHLIPMIQQLLTNCALTINDVTGVLVSEGPGSFTGIRIGMATAKGLAQTLKVPMVGVPTLQSFAYHFECEDVIVCPVFDARREQVYAGAYGFVKDRGGQSAENDCETMQSAENGCEAMQSAENGCEAMQSARDCCEAVLREEVLTGAAVQLVEDGAYDLKEFLARLENLACEAKFLFFGDGLDRYHSLIEQWEASVKDRGIAVEYAPQERRYQEALSVAKLGRKMFEEGKQKPFSDMEPVYLRQAEAQRKLEERLALEKQ